MRERELKGVLLMNVWLVSLASPRTDGLTTEPRRTQRKPILIAQQPLKTQCKHRGMIIKLGSILPKNLAGNPRKKKTKSSRPKRQRHTSRRHEPRNKSCRISPSSQQPSGLANEKRYLEESVELYGRPVFVERGCTLVHHRRHKVLRVHPLRQLLQVLRNREKTGGPDTDMLVSIRHRH